MYSIVVIRRLPSTRFPEALRKRAAELLQRDLAEATKMLTGSGWAWIPGRRSSIEAARLSRALNEAGMQAGSVAAQDAASLETTRQFDRIALENGAFVLSGQDIQSRINADHPGGAILLGLRWDGQAIRPHNGAKRPGMLIWSGRQPMGVIWLRAKPGEPGSSAAELAALITQSATQSWLKLLDDSFQPGDISPPSPQIRATWERAGGHPDDAKVLLHGLLLQNLQETGVLSSRENPKPDLDAPLKFFHAEKRPWLKRLLLNELVAWSSALTALFMLWYAPNHPLATVLGVLAGLCALGNSLYILGAWARLTSRPISKVRSMALGTVRLAGEIEEAMMLSSPLRGIRCVYYKTKTETRNYKGNWRTVHAAESPGIPFYLNDTTGRVLIDTKHVEWIGLETYEQRIGANTRSREWVLADGVHAQVYGYAVSDADAPIVRTIREGIETLFLSNQPSRFDLNRDGVISASERRLAGAILDNQIRADAANTTLQSGLYITAPAGDRVIVSSNRALPLGLLRGLEAAFWIGAGFVFLLITFVYRDAAVAVLQNLLSR